MSAFPWTLLAATLSIFIFLFFPVPGVPDSLGLAVLCLAAGFVAGWIHNSRASGAQPVSGIHFVYLLTLTSVVAQARGSSKDENAVRTRGGGRASDVAHHSPLTDIKVSALRRPYFLKLTGRLVMKSTRQYYKDAMALLGSDASISEGEIAAIMGPPQQRCKSRSLIL